MDTSSPPESRLAAHTAQLTMKMSTFTVHDPINLNAQCADGGRGGGRGDKEKVMIKVKKHTRNMVQSFTEQEGFQIVCGSFQAFQSLEAELEKALKPNWFLVSLLCHAQHTLQLAVYLKDSISTFLQKNPNSWWHGYT